MNTLLKITAFLVVLVVVQGCATYKREVIKIDPSYNRVVIYNNSPYILQEDGIFNQSLDPGESAHINIPCYGRFKGLVTAYRMVGTRSDGEKMLEYYGQRKYSVRVDGRNYVRNELSVDYYVEFRQGNFRPSRRGREYFFAPKRSLCGSNSSIRIFLGR